jgi:hypothetical protein
MESLKNRKENTDRRIENRTDREVEDGENE